MIKLGSNWGVIGRKVSEARSGVGGGAREVRETEGGREGMKRMKSSLNSIYQTKLATTT